MLNACILHIVTYEIFRTTYKVNAESKFDLQGKCWKQIHLKLTYEEVKTLGIFIFFPKIKQQVSDKSRLYTQVMQVQS